MLILLGLMEALLLGTLVLGISRGRRQALWSMGFVAPMQGLALHAGVSFAWISITVVVAAIYSIVARLPSRRRFSSMPGAKILFVFVFYAAAVTAYFWMFDPTTQRLISTARAIGWGPGQSDYRHIVQFLMLLIGIGAAYWFYKIVQSREDLASLCSGFIAGNITSLTVGFYQAFAVANGWPYLNAAGAERWLGSNLGIHEGVVTYPLFGGLTFSRLWGLGAEPKHTAAFALLALAIVFACAGVSSRDDPLFRRRARLEIVVLVFGIGLTLSTSGWIAFVVLLVYAFLALGKTSGKKLVKQVVPPAVVIAIPLLLMGSAARTAIYEQRVQTRIIDNPVQDQEFKDGAFLDYAEENPSTLITGHGVGGVDFYLVEYVPRANPDGTLTPAYLVTRFLGDVGVIGLSLFILTLGAWWMHLAGRRDRVGRMFVIGASIVLLVASNMAQPVALMLLGGFLGGSSAGPRKGAPSRLARPLTASRTSVPQPMVQPHEALWV